MKRTGVFYQLIYHFVWSTKNREPCLTATVEACLFPYISAKCQELGYTLYAVNGAWDHLHVLLGLTPSILVADVAKNLKGASSHFITHDSGLEETLYWQDGYGVMTIRQAEIPRVVRYIQNQKEYHRTGKMSELLERIQP
ncbi:MAG: IS200/IS605 family transposase [Chloroflexi bacterium]|nr:IS200/IS605 family transposase [Chloroflexota bacterium]